MPSFCFWVGFVTVFANIIWWRCDLLPGRGIKMSASISCPLGHFVISFLGCSEVLCKKSSYPERLGIDVLLVISVVPIFFFFNPPSPKCQISE